MTESTRWSVTLSAGVLSVTGKAVVFRRARDPQPWFVAMSGLARTLEATPYLELRGGLPVLSKVTVVMLIVVGIMLMFAVILLPKLQLFSTHAIWPVAVGMAVLLQAVCMGLFSLLVRNNPFAWTFARTAILYMGVFSMTLCVPGANRLNCAIPSANRQTVVLSGWLQQTNGRNGPAYAIAPADHAPISAFGVQTGRIFLSYREYRDLLGRDRIMDGRFEITVNKGWLGAPYIEHVRRIDSPG
jgi:hypothetical protein